MNNLLLESFSKQAVSISPTDIENLQSHFEIELPTAYVDFMKNYGEVLFETPLPNSVLVEIAGKQLIAGMVSFLSPTMAYEMYQVLREDTPYADEPQISEHMLPIIELVDMDESDYIVLNLKDGNVWATVFDYSMESNPETYGFIADDFERFLEKIQTQEGLESQVGSGGDTLLGIYNLVETE